MTDDIGAWFSISSGSALVSVMGAFTSAASAVIAWRSMQQARQAAALSHRLAAIEHLREALRRIKDGGGKSDSVTSIQNAMDLSETVFSQQIRRNLQEAHMTASRLMRAGPIEYTVQRLKDSSALPEDLENLITRMQQEAAFVH